MSNSLTGLTSAQISTPPMTGQKSGVQRSNRAGSYSQAMPRRSEHAAILGDGGGLPGTQRVESNIGCPLVEQGRGAFFLRPSLFAALSRRAGGLQKRLPE